MGAFFSGWLAEKYFPGSGLYIGSAVFLLGFALCFISCRISAKREAERGAAYEARGWELVLIIVALALIFVPGPG